MQDFLTVLHAISSHARTIPEKVAIIEGQTDRKCTYGELWAYVKAFSKRLRDTGVKSDFGDGFGTRVVVRCTQTIDYVVTMLAIQLAGGVFVPVEANIAEARIIEIMQETDSSILVAAKPLSGYECTYIPLSEATAGRDDEGESVTFPEPEKLANILFTTGTTGKSKGVMLSLKSFVAKFKSHYYSYFLEFNQNDEQVCLLPNPLSHMSGINRTCISIFSQSTVVLLDGYQFPINFFSAVLKYKVTYINLMSSATEMYLRMCRKELKEISNHIKLITLVSSAFTETQISSLRSIFSLSKIIQTYGSTEVGACYVEHHVKKYPPLCLGKPMAGTEVVFFDEQKNCVVETNSKNPGLIAVDSDTKMLGYWKNPELTARVTRGEYIVLADLGYKGDDGLYYFFARADDVIVSGAYKIAPLEIEEIANSFDDVRESACVGVSDPIMGQVPKLYVVMKEGVNFDFREIYNYLKDKLETSRIPRYIEEIDEIPKINNKINRKELKE